MQFTSYYNEHASFWYSEASYNNNLLLTEREGRTGEYWPEVVAIRTERSKVRTKRPRANIPRYGSS